jgi:hypothetical protein
MLFRSSNWQWGHMGNSERKTILGASQRLIWHNRTLLWFVRRAFCSLSLALILFGAQPAHANQCFIAGPRYLLEGDTVEWRIKIRSRESCVHGVRFSYVYNATVSLVTPPQSGHVTIVGLGFLYTSRPDFQGEDSFVVGVRGSKNKTTGFSKIRVVMSVVGTNQAFNTASSFEEKRLGF